MLKTLFAVTLVVISCGAAASDFGALRTDSFIKVPPSGDLHQPIQLPEKCELKEVNGVLVLVCTKPVRAPKPWESTTRENRMTWLGVTSRAPGIKPVFELR